MTFRIKTAVLFILLSLIPISIVSSLVFIRGKIIIENKTTVHLTTTNTLKSEILGQWVRHHGQILETAAAIPELAPGCLAPLMAGTPSIGCRLRNALVPFIKTRQFLELFLVAPDSGQVVFSTDPLQEGKFKDHQDFFKKGKTEAFVQDIFFDLATGKPVLFFARPMKDANNDLYALIVGRADLAGLSKDFEKQNLLSRTEDTYLVNKFNYFITEPRFGKGYALKKSIANPLLESARQNGKVLGNYMNYRGAEVLGEVRWLEDIRLYIISEIQSAEAHEPVQRLKKQVLLIVLILAAVSALTGWFLAATITEPLTALINAAGHVGKGEFRIKLNARGKGELYNLVRSFEAMADRLARTMVSKEKLEKEVEIRRAAEAELKSAVNDLKQSNQDLQQFAYVASHDLQEPLRMVASFTQLLADRYRDALDDKARTWIDFAVDGATRMQKLIQDLLSFSRVSTHGRRFENTDLAACLKVALKNLSLAVEESGARIETDDLPVVQADENQMVMLFQNLIGNSIKFCKDKVPEIRISSEKKEQDWEIRVQDNGIGIEPEFVEKIFIIFQRLHTREEYQGTGLGLAVCKRIAQRHGGRIWVTSRPGEGTLFHIVLPARQRQAGKGGTP